MPAWIFRRAKSLDLCGLQRAETEQAVSYPSEAQKCLSIVPRGAEKAGKKSLASYPLLVATCLPAVELVCFQTFLIGGWLSACLSFCVTTTTMDIAALIFVLYHNLTHLHQFSLIVIRIAQLAPFFVFLIRII